MKTVAGMFDDAVAIRVRTELASAGYTSLALRTRNSGGGLQELIGAGIPEKDARLYVDELADGGTLVTVDCNDADAPKALAIMNRFGTRESRRAVRREEREERVERREARAESREARTGEVRGAEVRGEASIPIVEEKVTIGKETYDAGGVRVHPRVVETPVEKDVNVRTEHVEVERRRVDRPATDRDFERADLEMHERSERPTTRKRAHVVEEVRLNKTHDQHQERIHDVERHTEVDVEKVAGREPARGAAEERGRGLRGAEPRDYIPIVEEEIEVDKADFDAGGVAIHSRVVETPIDEDVTLDDEHVVVERKHVDRDVTESDLAPPDLEASERSQRPVVKKTARVVEEVRLKRSVEEHPEKVRGTVRHTEIEVEHLRPLSGWDNAAKGYRAHFDRSFGGRGEKWESYEPAYRLGHELGSAGTSDWTGTERYAQNRWEKSNPGTWARFKEAVREAFDRARESLRGERRV